MRILWQSFVDPEIAGDYLAHLSNYLNRIAQDGVEVVVRGISPPDRDFGRLSEFRCAAVAIDRALALQPGEFDAYVLGHFQDPGLYEIRSCLDIPVIGTGEASLLAGSTLGRRLGLISLAPEYEVYHHEQADRYGLGARLVKVASLSSTPQEFNASFAGDAEAKAVLLDKFKHAADVLLAAGADVIITAGVLPGLFVADYPGLTFGHAPVLNCASVALKSAEMWLQLHKIDAIGPSRGPSYAKPKGQAQQDMRNLLKTDSGNGTQMLKPDSVLYTAQAYATGGREGTAETTDGRLSVKLNVPTELGGPGGDGTNPEQLFAAGYAACFLSAVKLVARIKKIPLTEDAAITAIVGTGRVGDRYALQTELQVSLPGVETAMAQEIVNGAHERCPYSNATRGNMEVVLAIV